MKKVIASVPAIILMIIIFILSNQPAVESSKYSNSLTVTVLSNINSFFGMNMDEDDIKVNADMLETLVRKFAHVTEYMLLAMAYSLSFYQWDMEKKRLLATSFICAVLYAITDEIHQYFIPGRACMITDVFIDSIGAFIGIGFVWIFVTLKDIMKTNKRMCKD